MDKIYSVTELSGEIKYLLETGFSYVWVEGEISSLRQPISGHVYFNLKDAESQIRVVLFRNVAGGLKFKLEDGVNVILAGRVSAYQSRSEYQVIGQKIEPRGLGALQIAFEELKKRLAAEGLFAPERKRPIPYLIRRLAVVTSPTGAAVRDILQVLQRRNPAIEVVIYPALVQGKEAAAEIVKGIREFNRLAGFDAIILARGGGSLEDLWAFNEEAVARAIAGSTIPIISAIGHEVDYTISDFVADLRAPTPSAAAEIISLHREETFARVATYFQRMAYLVRNQLQEGSRRLETVKGRYGFQRPADLLSTFGQRIDELSERMARSENSLLDKFRKRWEALGRQLSGLSPLAVLERGYSITLAYPEGKVVKDAESVDLDQVILTRLAKGRLISRITEKKNDGI
ncbi:MAG: exodeoxyribonuclease VII large subunit [Candidatus Omnitrophica bacterium]|nr:exodeoxyribonuclease VII large subunit [Candidatus Omnitrophota bacterium]